MPYTATGDYGGYEDANVDFDTSERKTQTVNNSTNRKTYYSTNQAGTNVLNNYRSINYNFTLAAITKDQANHPEKFDPKNPNFVVATSKGKTGNRRINQLVANTNNTAKSVKTTQAQPSNITKLAPITESDTVNVDPMGNIISVSNQLGSDNEKVPPNSKQSKRNQLTPQQIADSINDFSKDSPGSFDLFIDDVVINSTYGFKNGLNSLPTHVDFTVVEPYSINGFIEALQICALAAGYNDYISSDYVLILDFMGYPDTGDTPIPEFIPNSTRIFFIRITGIQISVSESGSVYKVSAVPLSDRAQGDTVSSIKRKMIGEGNTVKELLTNVVTGLNNQAKDDALSSSNQLGFDDYAIMFPVYDSNGEIIPGQDNKIASEKFYEDSMVSPINTAMTPIGTTKSGYSAAGSDNISMQQSSSTALYKHTAHYDSGVSITDIISSAVRDSNYIGKIIKAFQKGGDVNSVIDSNGFLNYFVITPKIIAKAGLDNPATNRPYCTYVYLVEVYKIVYNMAVPGTSRLTIDAKKLKNFSLRNYDYFYTGLNVDVLDFKINLNNLFFEELPKALGNNESNPRADSAKSSDTNDTKQNSTNHVRGGKNSEGMAPQYATSNASTTNPNDSINSTSPEASGWRQAVKVMHETISNSTGLISGELSIVGDPYYITATGSGNSLNKNSQVGQLANGQEAAIRAGRVLISLSFNNPDDIGKSGFMTFNNNPIPISGLYQINIVKSTFKEGVFKQQLSILRVPGQTLQSTQSVDDPGSAYSSYPNPKDQTAVSSGPPVPSYSVNTNDGTIGLRADTLNLQSLIGNTPTANPGGLGGSANPVFGAINPAGNLPSAIFGTVPNGVNQLATGIRAAAAGLYATQNSQLNNASLVLGTSKILNSINSNFGQITNQLTNNLIDNQYTLKDSLGVNSLNAASSNISSNLNDIANKINQTVSQSVNDALGLSRLFGVNASQISGLNGIVNSKLLSSLNGLSEVIPTNVNLQTAAKQGIQLDGLTAEGLSKLPPIPSLPIGIRSPGFDNGNNVGGIAQSAAPQFNQIDSYTRSEKINSSFKLYNEVAKQLLPTDITYDNNQNFNAPKSVVSLYGSRSKNSISPLLAALNNNNI
jgi:hypothetical protein